MPLSFFKHDVRAARDPKCSKLIQALGWEGYGLFWGVLEALFEADRCELEYNLPNLSWRFHCDSEMIRAVIEDFGLFEIHNGRFWSNRAKKRFQEYEKRTHRCSVAGRRGGRASGEVRRARKKGAPEAEEQTPPQAVEESAEVADDGQVDDAMGAVDEPTPAYSNLSNLSTEIIALWNEEFKGTKQAYRGLTLDAISFKRAQESVDAGYTLGDFKEAFQVAKKDTFPWLLISAVKPDNIQLLLSKGEKGKEANAQNGGYNAELSATQAAWSNVDWAQFERRE